MPAEEMLGLRGLLQHLLVVIVGSLEADVF